MRQFEPDKTFDQLLVQNQLLTEHTKQTVKIIAAFHHRIERAAVNTRFGNTDTVMRAVRENFSQILQLDGIKKPDGSKHPASWSEKQRELFSQQAEQLQIPFQIVHTRIDKQNLLQRINDCYGQQDNVSEEN